jgi:hypothetical protein
MSNICIVLAIILASPCYSVEKRWISWVSISGATAKRGEHIEGIYQNPENKDQVVVYPSCWLFDRKTRNAVSLNCAFRQDRKGTILWDRTWGTPIGVKWGDAKMDNISFWDLIFRRPRFKETSVEVWDGDNWIVVTGLPK